MDHLTGNSSSQWDLTLFYSRSTNLNLHHISLCSDYFRMAFFGAAGVAVASFVNDRKEGFWNRSLMAGVTASEMIVAQISIHSVMVLIQVLEMVLTAGYLLHFTIKGSLSLVLTILALYSWTGLFLGLFVSILSSSLMVGNAILFGFSSPMVFLSGMKIKIIKL